MRDDQFSMTMRYLLVLLNSGAGGEAGVEAGGEAHLTGESRRIVNFYPPTTDSHEYYVRPSFQPNNNVRPPVFS